MAGSQDGSAATATFNRPTWLDVDPSNGAIYVVDRANDAVRKILNGTVTTVNFRESSFDPVPRPVVFDFGGPYGGGIAVEPFYAGCGAGQYAHGIFLSTSAQHRLTFVADFGWGAEYAARDDSSPLIGTGVPGANDGEQSVASFNSPGDVALSWGYVGGGGTFENDRLYIADTGNHTIRRIRFRLSFEACPQPYFIETEAGVAGEAGSDDGPFHSARFHSPRGIAAAPDGSIYVADTGNHTIRRITASGVTTVAGLAGSPGWFDGPAAVSRLNSPAGIDVNENGEVFIADSGNHLIRKLNPDGTLVTIAGTFAVVGHADGHARTAKFAGPVGVRVVGNTLLVADTSNNAIRMIHLDAPGPRRRAAGH